MDKKRILIIDDDPGIGESLSDIFQEKGYLVFIATKGSEAIGKLKKTNFNIALIDIKLPDMSGIALLKEVREINPDLICMIITGHASIDNAVNTLKYGASAYITKPLDMDDLLNRIKDALDKQRLKQELKESEEKHRTLLNNINDLVIEIDSENKFTYVSPQVFDMFGYTQEEAIGLNVFDLVHPDDIKYIKVFEHGNKVKNFEYRSRHKDGHYIHVSISGRYVTDTAGEFKMVSVITDITKRKKAEEVLIKKNKELQTFNDITVGRELRILELKKEINELLKKTGQKPKYEIPV